MPIAIKVNDVWSDGKRLHAVGTLTFSGDYTTDGEFLDFLAAGVQAPAAEATFASIQGSLGYNGQYNTIDGKLPMWSAAGTELTGASAYPDDVIANPFQYHAIWPQL